MTEFASSARVVIDFITPWTAVSVHTQGNQSGFRCHRDHRGLPALPMSQVKGTLRETAERLARAGAHGITSDRIRLLFGGRWKADDSREVNQLAVVTSLDAVIADEVAADLSPQKETLFQSVRCPPLKADRLACARTMRSYEVSIPLVLIGKIYWSATTPADFDWIGFFDRICARTTNLGPKELSSRGFGQARIFVQAESEFGATAVSGGSA